MFLNVFVYLQTCNRSSLSRLLSQLSHYLPVLNHLAGIGWVLFRFYPSLKKNYLFLNLLVYLETCNRSSRSCLLSNLSHYLSVLNHLAGIGWVLSSYCSRLKKKDVFLNLLVYLETCNRSSPCRLLSNLSCLNARPGIIVHVPNFLTAYVCFELHLWNWLSSFLFLASFNKKKVLLSLRVYL